MNGLVEWTIFLALSLIAVVTAGGMLITMSMYRAGLALMSSFLALAGLFILLDADLLAAIQVMMNVGGMLVMVLFMVMLMMDPGGEMMWDMKRKMHLPGPGAFSMSIPRGAAPSAAPKQDRNGAEAETDWTCPMHPEVSERAPGACPKCGMDLVPTEASPPEPATAQSGNVYTCPMHPEVRQDGPGSCPKCGMDLVPAEQDDQQQAHRHVTASQDSRAVPADGGTTSSMAMDHGGGGHADTMPLGHPAGERNDGMAKGQSDGDGHGAMAMDHSGSDTAGMSGMNAQQHREMMVGMAMSTAQVPWALALGAASAVALIVLIVRTAWPLAITGPTHDATVAVGELLLSRYMIGFEGAAFLILAGIAGAVIFGTRDGEPPAPPKSSVHAADREQQVYTCPMHPEVRQGEPGACPKCGMDLIPADDTGNDPPDGQQTFTCPMHPEVRQAGPGACPKCGMDLVPVDQTPVHAGAGGGEGSGKV